jgi:hypothetical protein
MSKKECLTLLKNGGYLVRNDYDFDTKAETSFWYVIKDSFGGMEELSTKVRNQIRRAQKTLDIRLIDKTQMLAQAYKVHCGALANYKVKAEIPSEEQFLEGINNQGENVDFWGCFDKQTGEMAAFSINHIYENQCSYSTFKSLPKYLKGYYPFYGLLYEMNRYYLQELKLKYVCDGARSITEHSNIQPFLIEKFNFRKAYCQLHIEYVWWMKMAVLILYPFRRIISLKKIKYILNMEAMRRGEF